MTRISLKQRGVGYVLVQGILIGLILFGPRGSILLPDFLIYWLPYLQVLGTIICILGLLFSLVAALNLGPNLTPLPCPKDHAQLVQLGLYRFVRHPIYSGVLMVALGWLCIYPYLFVLMYAIALTLFFEFKIKREERWLLEKFPAYSEYRQKVKKLIPWVY
ncbi:methyltransferase family protein [Polynucleobacter sinensis]|uniref:methyltransferase family protein n=1 Tax=Polynucleobacter sinensis TaxID=1743157 RepID=UPI000783BDAF|nr:isoprenylcysteine carboxylmethyltransferase family protein [Polynucleobacter sinensis]